MAEAEQSASQAPSGWQRIGWEVACTFALVLGGTGATVALDACWPKPPNSGATTRELLERWTYARTYVDSLIWGLTVSGIVCIGLRWRSCDVHMNPAVSLALKFAGLFAHPAKRPSDAGAGPHGWPLLLLFIVAQCLGAAAASAALRTAAPTHPDLGGTISARIAAGWPALALEVIATVLLVAVVVSIDLHDPSTPHGTRRPHRIRRLALAVGVYVTLISMTVGPVGGASMNPARSFGPALAAWDWSHVLVWTAGPLIGALLAGLAWRAGVGHTRPAPIRALRIAASALLLWTLALIPGGAWFMTDMPGESFRGPLPPLSPAQAALRDELAAHVHYIAGELGEHNMLRPAAYAAAADYIEMQLRAASRTRPDAFLRRQSFPVGAARAENIILELPGGARRDEVLVVGAHYDSVEDCPGANDNTTGVAALICLAERLAPVSLARTLRLVALANEEQPFSMSMHMGSLAYATHCRDRGDRIVGMISLETMGYFSDAPGSQRYPQPFGLLYPAQGDFIAFVGDIASRPLLHEAIRAFRENAAFPSEGGALPGFIDGVGWSDHWSFWQIGVPAIMVTDTAPFRYPHYHRPTDTPDKVDYDRLARVVDGMTTVIRSLARRDSDK